MPARLRYDKPKAADQLSVTVRMLERLISDGEVATVRLGRRRLVARDHLEDYVQRLRGRR